MKIPTNIRLGTGPEIFSSSGLAAHHHGAFVLASVYELLAELGETGSCSTEVSVRGSRGWRPLAQFDPLPWDENGTLMLRASGDRSQELAERLPGGIVVRLANLEFDPDGFAMFLESSQADESSAGVPEVALR